MQRLAAGSTLDQHIHARPHTQVAGLVMAPVAMLLMGYALWMYRKRTAQVLRRETVRCAVAVGAGTLRTVARCLARCSAAALPCSPTH